MYMIDVSLLATSQAPLVFWKWILSCYTLIASYVFLSLSSVDVGKSPVIPYVYVNCSGTVKNYKPIQVVSACHLEIYAFPFDKQNCTLTFRSWLHSGKWLTHTQLVLSLLCKQAGLRIMRAAVITECFWSAWLESFKRCHFK